MMQKLHHAPPGYKNSTLNGEKTLAAPAANSLSEPTFGTILERECPVTIKLHFVEPTTDRQFLEAECRHWLNEADRGFLFHPLHLHDSGWVFPLLRPQAFSIIISSFGFEHFLECRSQNGITIPWEEVPARESSTNSRSSSGRLLGC